MPTLKDKCGSLRERLHNLSTLLANQGIVNTSEQKEESREMLTSFLSANDPSLTLKTLYYIVYLTYSSPSKRKLMDIDQAIQPVFSMKKSDLIRFINETIINQKPIRIPWKLVTLLQPENKKILEEEERKEEEEEEEDDEVELDDEEDDFEEEQEDDNSIIPQDQDQEEDDEEKEKGDDSPLKVNMPPSDQSFLNFFQENAIEDPKSKIDTTKPYVCFNMNNEMMEMYRPTIPEEVYNASYTPNLESILTKPEYINQDRVDGKINSLYLFPEDFDPTQFITDESTATKLQEKEKEPDSESVEDREEKEEEDEEGDIPDDATTQRGGSSTVGHKKKTRKKRGGNDRYCKTTRKRFRASSSPHPKQFSSALPDDQYTRLQKSIQQCTALGILPTRFCIDLLRLQLPDKKPQREEEGEKEKTERDTRLFVEDPHFPSIEDPLYYSKMTDYFSGITGDCNYKVPVPVSNQGHRCLDRDLSVQQRFVADFVSPLRKNASKGVLIYHAPGTGKTILAGSIISEFTSSSPTTKIIFVCKNALVSNAEKEIYSLPFYMFKGTSPDETPEPKQTEKESYIKKRVLITTYIKFAQRLSGKTKWESMFTRPDNQIEEPLLNNTLIIFDEIHNILDRLNANQNESFYQYHENQLFTSLRRARQCRFIFMTATPISRQTSEIAILMNLCKHTIEPYKDQTITIDDAKKYQQFPQVLESAGFVSNVPLYQWNRSKTQDLFDQLFVDPATASFINSSLFISFCKGHVSYFNNVRDSTLYPTQKKLLIHQIPMSSLQLTVYHQKKKSPKMGMLLHHRWSPTTSSSTKKKKNRNEGDNAGGNEEEGNKVDFYQELQQVMNAPEPMKIKQYTRIDLSKKLPKIHFLIENMYETAREGKQILYSSLNSIYGINILVRGFHLRPDLWNHLTLTKIKQTFAYQEKKGGKYHINMTQYETLKKNSSSKEANVRNYIVLFSTVEENSSTVCTEKEKQLLIDMFNHPQNDKGEYINSIFLSSQYTEGISLFSVRHFHFFDIPATRTKYIQALARSIRRCSHQRLSYSDPYEWTVQPHLYVSVFPNVEKKVSRGGRLEGGGRAPAPRRGRMTSSVTTPKTELKKTKKTTKESSTKKTTQVVMDKASFCNELSDCTSNFCYRNASQQCVERSIDSVIRNRMEKKSIQESIYQSLQSSAVDCEIFKNVNDTEQLSCFIENSSTQQKELIPSLDVELESLRHLEREDSGVGDGGIVGDKEGVSSLYMTPTASLTDQETFYKEMMENDQKVRSELSCSIYPSETLCNKQVSCIWEKNNSFTQFLRSNGSCHSFSAIQNQLPHQKCPLLYSTPFLRDKCEKDQFCHFNDETQHCENLYPALPATKPNQSSSPVMKYQVSIGFPQLSAPETAGKLSRVPTVYEFFYMQYESLRREFVGICQKFKENPSLTTEQINGLYVALSELFMNELFMTRDEFKLFKSIINTNYENNQDAWKHIDYQQILKLEEYYYRLKQLKEYHPHGHFRVVLTVPHIDLNLMSLFSSSSSSSVKFDKNHGYLHYTLHFVLHDQKYYFASKTLAGASLPLDDNLRQIQQYKKIIGFSDLQVTLTFHLEIGVLLSIDMLLKKIKEDSPPYQYPELLHDSYSLHLMDPDEKGYDSTLTHVLSLTPSQCVEFYRQRELPMAPLKDLSPPIDQTQANQCYHNYRYHRALYPHDHDLVIMGIPPNEDLSRQCRTAVVDTPCTQHDLEDCKETFYSSKECRSLPFPSTITCQSSGLLLGSTKKCQSTASSL